MVRPAVRREVAGHLKVAYGISERRACQATGFGRSPRRYRKRSDPQDPLRMRLKEPAAMRVRYGYRRAYLNGDEIDFSRPGEPTETTDIASLTAVYGRNA